MSHKHSIETDDWLNLLDLGAIADPADKLSECESFLELATQESDKEKFRWLISAFFGAAYSFFEINALRAHHSFHNPVTGEPIENDEALKTLRRYVQVKQDPKRPTRVDTAGQHEITKQLYALRRGNIHHFPMSLMTNGENLPEGFHFGNISGKGVPALFFCRQVMSLIHLVEKELRQHY